MVTVKEVRKRKKETLEKLIPEQRKSVEEQLEAEKEPPKTPEQQRAEGQALIRKKKTNYSKTTNNNRNNTTISFSGSIRRIGTRKSFHSRTSKKKNKFRISSRSFIRCRKTGTIRRKTFLNKNWPKIIKY